MEKRKLNRIIVNKLEENRTFINISMSSFNISSLSTFEDLNTIT